MGAEEGGPNSPVAVLTVGDLGTIARGGTDVMVRLDHPLAYNKRPLGAVAGVAQYPANDN